MNTTRSTRLTSAIFILIAFAILFPVFVEYLAGFLLLMWLSREFWNHRQERLLSLTLKETGSWTLHRGVLALFASAVIATLLALFLSPYLTQSGTKILRSVLNAWLRNGMLWFTFVSGLMLIQTRGVDLLKIIKPLFWLFVIQLVYVLLQRSIGIDLSHGFTARLPAHRFAYDVFRPSGAFGHPLTFAYNLVLLAINFWVVLVRYGSALSLTNKRLGWAAFGLLVLTLFLTASRWPLFVLAVAVAASQPRWIWRHRKWFAIIAVMLVAFVWWEGTMLGRLKEVLQNQSLAGASDSRLVFWKIHLNIFLDFPWSGTGLTGIHEARTVYYEAAGVRDKLYSAHNIFIQTLADSGLVGFAGLLAFMAGLAAHAFRSRDGSGVFLLVFFLSGLMQDNFRDSEFLYAFWVCLAFVVVLGRRFQANGDGWKSRSSKSQTRSVSNASSVVSARLDSKS